METPQFAVSSHQDPLSDSKNSDIRTRWEDEVSEFVGYRLRGEPRERGIGRTRKRV